jgi:FtsP/CotA-like multicopper oxidase with cupredoxin domain
VLEKIPINPLFLVSLTLTLTTTGIYGAINPANGATPISVSQYDKMKNCTQNLSKHPTSIEYLTYFNCGHVSSSSNGQTIRDFTLIINENQKIPISDEGHIFDGWTFNGTIPGPTMRVTEGDHVRIKVINSPENKHAHSLHLHSIHAAGMDGVSMGGYPGGAIPPGGSFVYEFNAAPYGVFPYHCHVDPIADHINRGLYGMFIIDPKTPRTQMTEFAMLMNGYDLNFDKEGPVGMPTPAEANADQQAVKPVVSTDDQQAVKPVVSKGSHDHEKGKTDSGKGKKLSVETSAPAATDNASDNVNDGERDNEIYTVNGKAFQYMTHPIPVQAGKPYRIYLVNMLEFDLINSFHMHGTMFNYTIAGTEEKPNYMTDIVTMAQGDRGIVEFRYDYPGKYMFHAHQAEFTDKGWMGLFDVKPNAIQTTTTAAATTATDTPSNSVKDLNYS